MDMRTSKKRDAIYNAILNDKSHPSAHTVYAGLKDKIPDLSLGTVYRNIALFKNQGKIVTVSTIGGEERYDATVNPHMHFVCSKCGDVVDISEHLDLSRYEEKIEGKINVKIESHNVIFNGSCNSCKNRKN